MTFLIAGAAFLRRAFSSFGSAADQFFKFGVYAFLGFNEVFYARQAFVQLNHPLSGFVNFERLKART